MTQEPDLQKNLEVIPEERPRWRDRLPGPLATLFDLTNATPEVDTFAIVTFAPVPLLIWAGVFGGWPAWLALIWIALFIFALDEIVARAAPDAPEGSEFPAADTLSIALAGAHFVLLILGVAALSGHTLLEGPSWVAVLLAYGLFFGQVSNSNAHELIHRRDKRLFALGKWVYISLLYGHHSSAHRHVHHRFVATPDDPNSAQPGEGFWSFVPRAWSGSFVAGLEMERNLAQRRTLPEGADWRKRLRARIAALGPYPSYVLGALWFVLLFGGIFGLRGVLAYLFLCLYAQLQLLLSDYVQHYGLERVRRGDGSYEPVSLRHSWDAPHPVSALWMLNAPRHSDHHAHPGREYPALRLGDLDAPQRPVLPRSLPAMAALALIPPLWRRVMDKRVAALKAAERRAQG
ncbi:alkane 1-monooxygenase [Thioclava sp. 15-R06ZXC-3]|uniref:Alkane 1-monooxygenase n=1 Tax=Thioclava arctica TaxID=3238301 RepID=A0ABV3TGG4_9RHOB